MSAFVVLVPFEARPPDHDALARIAAGLAHRSRGPVLTGSTTGGVCWAVARDAAGIASSPAVTYDPVRQRLLLADAAVYARRDLVAALRARGAVVSGGANAEGMGEAALLSAAYDAWGDDFPAHVHGDYAVACVDAATRHVMAWRDPFGVRTLFHAAIPGGVVVGSDLAAVLAHPAVDRTPDRQAMLDYLLLGTVDALDRSQTPYVGVRAVPEACRWSVREGRARLVLHPVPGLHEPEPVAAARPAALLARLDALLREAVRDRVAGRDVCLLLSGGLDSGVLAAVLAALRDAGEGPRTLTALTVVTGHDDPELPGARAVARRFGIAHEVTTLDLAEVAPPPPTLYPVQSLQLAAQWRVHARAAALGDVWISGSGMDELFAPERTSLRRTARRFGIGAAMYAVVQERWQDGRWTPAGRRADRRAREAMAAAVAAGRPGIPSWLAPSPADREACEARWEAFWRWRSLEPVGWRIPRHPEHPRAQRAFLRGHWARRDEPQAGLGDVQDVMPALDLRLVRAVWAAPARPWCVDKGALRTLFTTRLPATVGRAPKRVRAPESAPNRDIAAVADWRLSERVDGLIAREAVPPLGLTGPVDRRPFLLDAWLSTA